MPVANKLTSLSEFADKYENNSGFWYAYCQMEIIPFWIAVVKFIMWYNKQNLNEHIQSNN